MYFNLVRCQRLIIDSVRLRRRESLVIAQMNRNSGPLRTTRGVLGHKL
jgi:hypothetical protein